jgi:hypothetical protein
MPLPLSRRAGLLLVAAALAGCSPSGPITVDLDKLPPYEGEMAALFNDAIEPGTFKLTMVQNNPQVDPKFRARAQASDAVSEVQITTVTVSKADDKSAYVIQMEAGQSYKGRFEEDMREQRFSERDAQPYSIISTVRDKARGQKMIGFWKRFREKNRATIHYYYAPDDADTIKAVQDALALGALKNQ